jgi:hypothetical protein
VVIEFRVGGEPPQTNIPFDGTSPRFFLLPGPVQIQADSAKRRRRMSGSVVSEP